MFKWWLQPWNWKMFAPWKESYDKPRQYVKKQRYHFTDKGLYSQSYGFFSSHVWMWELDRKEGWVLKNWCFWTVVLEKTLESPLNCKEVKLVNPKGNQYSLEYWLEYSLEWVILKLTLQYFDHLIQELTLEKFLMLGNIEGKRRRRQQRMRWLDCQIASLDMNLSKLWEIVKGRGAWGAAVHGVAKSWTWLTDWT